MKVCYFFRSSLPFSLALCLALSLFTGTVSVHTQHDRQGIE
jgi:hypothetical protein